MLTTLRTILFVSLAAIVAACSSGDTIPSPAAASPLVTITTRAGLCVETGRMCESLVVVYGDGRIYDPAAIELATISPDRLAALEAAIRATDFAALRSHPFTGTCPTAYDGQELVFEFDTRGGVERIATCEVDVDFGQPLFVALSRVIGPLAPLPTT
jgi:hypothetical protein